MAANNLQTVTRWLHKSQDAFQAIPNPVLDFERERHFAKQQVTANSYLMGAVANNPQSLLDAMTNVAAIGLSLNPADKLAYLIPRKINNVQSCCLDISYRGLSRVAIDSGAVEFIRADDVFSNDKFEYYGPIDKPVHQYARGDRGELECTYAVAKTKGGDYLCEVMEVDELNKIRDCSEMYKRHQSGPWVDFPQEMRKKTVIKRLTKTLPNPSPELNLAIDALNQHEGIEFSERKSNFNLFMDQGDALGLYLQKLNIEEECERDQTDVLDVYSNLQQFPRGQIGAKRKEFKQHIDNGGACFNNIMGGVTEQDKGMIEDGIAGATDEALVMLENKLGPEMWAEMQGILNNE